MYLINMCMCVFSVFTHMHTYAHMYIIYTYSKRFVYVQSLVFICAYIHMHVRMFTCVYMCMHVYAYVYVFIHCVQLLHSIYLCVCNQHQHLHYCIQVFYLVKKSNPEWWCVRYVVLLVTLYVHTYVRM